jgi:N-methylhydantoinase A/oxoprolinase/acetone carboxylase beta subunit
MNLALGIDTGGTYTDAVLVEHATGRVIAGAKALTTRHELALGIRSAMVHVFAATAASPAPATPADVVLVALSTTLATNALAEGHRGTVCLLLIGYDPALMQQFGFEHELATSDVVYLGGGHDQMGNEVAPLDEETARAAILARRDSVEAFAVSGYFSVRNPAHELRVKALIEQLTGRPATCGHELTSRLNAVRRATTVALNAHLILPLRELIGSVQQTLKEQGISAPLMVVKGDGSLVRAEWATERPIETILSGPAASVVGAAHLADRKDVWVVDVGGTTTDIAALRDGWPILNQDGARVGGWRTMVEAIDVHTTGLGGDSHVRFDEERHLCIGPRRVVPLSLLAAQHPDVLSELRRQSNAGGNRRREDRGEFLVLGRSSGTLLDEQDRNILARLVDGPLSCSVLITPKRGGGLVQKRIEELEARLLVRRAGFTPSDALHVLGRYTAWNAKAARLGAEILAAQAALPVEEFCARVVDGLSERVAQELVSKIFEDEIGEAAWEREPLAQAMLERSFHGRNGSDLGCALTLHRPIVAIGAPVAAYMPDAARRLHTELVIPEHSGVANAVGAVAGGIVQRARVLINPLGDDGRVRLHLPDGYHDSEGLEPAVEYARSVMLPLVETMALRAGAEQVEVRMVRQDLRAPVARGQGDEVFLSSELTFTAAGRPSPARR